MERRLPETFYRYIPLKGSWAPAGRSWLRALKLQVFQSSVCKHGRVWLTDNLEVVWEDLKFNFFPVIALCCYFFIFLSSPGFSCTLWLNAFMCVAQGYSRRGNEFLITLCTTWLKCFGEHLEFLQIGVLAPQMSRRKRDALKGTALNPKVCFKRHVRVKCSFAGARVHVLIFLLMSLCSIKVRQTFARVNMLLIHVSLYV